MGIWQMNALELIIAGGPIMVPIIICSVFAFGVVIEKLLYFASLKTDLSELKIRVFNFVKQNQIKEALKVCENNPSPVAKILKAGILRFGASREEIKETIEESSLLEIPRLEKNLTALATIAHITPLLGLLGTVAGLCGSFFMLQAHSNSLNPVSAADMAGGIWQALITTMGGLMVGIPALVAYNFCVSRVNHFINDMERAATEITNLLCRLNEVKIEEE
jgi:biopolymer transport protein ExbB